MTEATTHPHCMAFLTPALLHHERGSPEDVNPGAKEPLCCLRARHHSYTPPAYSQVLPESSCNAGALPKVWFLGSNQKRWESWFTSLFKSSQCIFIRYWIGGCDGYQWLSAWLELEWPRRQFRPCLWGSFYVLLREVGKTLMQEAQFLGLSWIEWERRNWIEQQNCLCFLRPLSALWPHISTATSSLP